MSRHENKLLLRPAAPATDHRLAPMPYEDRLIRVSEVRRLAGIGRNTIYTWMGEGKFPLPVDLGGFRVAWRLSDINAWIASRPPVSSVRVKRGIKPWERASLDQRAG